MATGCVEGVGTTPGAQGTPAGARHRRGVMQGKSGAMKVKDIMTERVVSVSANASVAEAAAKMRDEKVGSVVVVDRGKLAGIITDRQITHTAVAEGLDPKTARVRDFMVADFLPLEPDMDLIKAVRLQRELAMRRLPVVVDGKPVGIVSVSDIAAFVKECIDCILVEGEVRVARREK